MQQAVAVDSTTSTPLTEDEANALRYVAGYVPFSLEKKLQHRPEFKHCLEHMAVKGSAESYMEYTKEWIKRINRGGLFKVHDEAYSFFVTLEMKVRQHLAVLFRSDAPSKQHVLNEIMQDADILFSWTIAADIDEENLSLELLSHVVELWITIRGFSAAGAWMEYYKQCKKDCVKGGLRKELKKKHEATESKE